MLGHQGGCRAKVTVAVPWARSGHCAAPGTGAARHLVPHGSRLPRASASLFPDSKSQQHLISGLQVTWSQLPWWHMGRKHSSRTWDDIVTVQSSFSSFFTWGWRSLQGICSQLFNIVHILLALRQRRRETLHPNILVHLSKAVHC